MAVHIRLKRLGAKKRPFYRIVAADSKSPRDGRFLETIGTYDPLTQPSTVKVKVERVEHWLSVGALPTDSVRDVLRAAGIMDEKGKLKRAPEGVTESAEAGEAGGE
jgi:small subunit ribosomal protein S16